MISFKRKQKRDCKNTLKKGQNFRRPENFPFAKIKLLKECIFNVYTKKLGMQIFEFIIFE